MRESRAAPAIPWWIVLGASVVLLSLLSYWLCPGHLYLYHDTLIYVPMMERLWDPSVLKADLVAARPHLAFTVYDEVALMLRRLSGLGFREVLTWQQWVFRALGILGVYLLARALKLSERKALLVAAISALGVTTVGAALASLEFEPVPRSFALPLILLALGLASHGRTLAAGFAGAVAFLYHPPIGYPFWAISLVLAVRPGKDLFTRKRFLVFLPLACAGAFLFVLSRLQAAASPPDPFFSRLGPFQEDLQRAFHPYLWISSWPARFVEHHLFLGLVTGLAFWRLRRSVDGDLRFFLIGLPLVGLLSMPASYLLLEKLKWALIPQFQPLRALVYLAIVTSVMSTAAGIKAVEWERYLEGFLWFAVAFAIPTEARVLHILIPRLTDLALPLFRRRMIIVVALALLACLAIGWETRRRRGAILLLSASMLVPFFLLPYFGRVNRFPPRGGPEVDDLSRWARASTSKEAVFQFADAGHDADPGIFRASALRPVYVDWYSNGQVNFFREFSVEWWSRWWKAMALRSGPSHVEDYQALGIDYVVVPTTHRLANQTAVYENSRFVVYRTKRLK